MEVKLVRNILFYHRKKLNENRSYDLKDYRMDVLQAVIKILSIEVRHFSKVKFAIT